MASLLLTNDLVRSIEEIYFAPHDELSCDPTHYALHMEQHSARRYRTGEYTYAELTTPVS